METKNITKEELKAWLDKKEDFLLLDVMNPEYYVERHIAGAENAPVYEVVFLEYVEKLASDKSKKIVVYSEAENSAAIKDAAMKLQRARYENVWEFSEGLLVWEKTGYPVETGEKVKVADIRDGTSKLNVEKSFVGWTGRNPKYAHRGIIKVKSGQVVFTSGKLSAGKIILDMPTITDQDLTDDMWRGVLEHHLKTSDFFNVEKFPEASFELTGAEKIVGAKIGTPNYQIKGELSIKETSREIEFPAMIAPLEDGTIIGSAHFDFDRTLWGVHYGSEKFFEKLGMHLVNDNVSMELFLVAE